MTAPPIVPSGGSAEPAAAPPSPPETFIAALLLTFLLMGYGGATRKEMDARVWDGGRFRPGAAAWLRRTSAINLGGLALILACMVLMRFGL